MSWPSAYGYKYTPIGLRQREKKDDASGTRSICTTVHLPQGGHLLDIERQYGIDGSMSKRETQNMEPSAVPPVIRPPIRASSPIFGGDFDPHAYEPRSFAPSDFERQADDIIANFRARQGLPLETAREAIQYLDDTYGKFSNTLRKESANHFLSWGYLGGKPGQQFVSSLDY